MKSLVEFQKVLVLKVKVLVKLKIDINKVGYERLGNISSLNKPRPLLLRFSNREDAILFFKNKRLLPKGILVNFDQTKNQRAKYNSLKLQMLKHNKQYTKNGKSIKYIAGEPVLVDLQKNASAMSATFQQANLNFVPSNNNMKLTIEEIPQQIEYIDDHLSLSVELIHSAPIQLSPDDITIHASAEGITQIGNSTQTNKRKRPGRPTKVTESASQMPKPVSNRKKNVSKKLPTFNTSKNSCTAKRKKLI